MCEQYLLNIVNMALFSYDSRCSFELSYSYFYTHNALGSLFLDDKGSAEGCLDKLQVNVIALRQISITKSSQIKKKLKDASIRLNESSFERVV